ncbi:hypothetical protein CHS0354_000769 [Potamilus streckersoni]|uniref:Cysteine synthase n=1 Tax=Potamilus streckersoni TaxID=2493646 RepID=A0AAE0W981_9BIVA|nr:hypothetical protein CHS0354_000769 [Potamilus streckersoni]
MNTVQNISQLVGATPLVELKNLNHNPRVQVLAKLEGQNPGGSVKDRPALSMILEAEQTGLLTPEITLIEPTSGNTGIALAMMARAKGYAIELVMPENATRERIQHMQAFGATVTLTSKENSMEGAIDFAHQKLKDNPDKYLMLNQFANPANPLAHYKTTGPEIWKCTHKSITHFVSAMGTTGTIMGVSRYLKEQNQKIKIIGVKPEDGASIPGIRRWTKEYLPKIFDASRVDEERDVSQTDAENMARLLASKESILSGISSGGAVTVALRIAAEIEEGIIVCVICDRGERYFSSNLFS